MSEYRNRKCEQTARSKEFAPNERSGNSPGDISPVALAFVKIRQELFHCGQSNFSKFLGRFYSRPYKLVLVLIRLPHDVFVSHIDAFLNLSRRQLIEGIAGDNTVSELKHFRIKTCRTVSTTNDAKVQLMIGQPKHSPIFVE